MNTLEPPFVLVALPQLQDPNFQKSVVLVVEHNEDGAMGFIVNRPSTMPVREIMVNQDIDIPSSVPAWIGGPVGADNGLVLHNQIESAANAVFSDQFTVSSSAEALRGLVTMADDYESHQGDPARPPRPAVLYPYRFLIGYSGWGASQLEDEIRLGTWIQLPFSNHLVFNTPWHEMWNSAMAMIGINPMELAPTMQPYLN